MPTREPEIMRRRPPYWLAMLITGGLVTLMEITRLYLLPDHPVLQAYAVPMLVFFWHRFRSLLWGMAIAFVGMTLVEVCWAWPEPLMTAAHQWTALAIWLTNIIVVAVAFHGVVAYRENRTTATNSLAANAELPPRNEVLAAREELTSGPNEQLQSQAEKMEQQAEELARQSDQLQTLNRELSRRENALQLLLQASRSLSDDQSVQNAPARICQVAVRLLEPYGCAAAILERRHDHVLVRAHCGFGSDEPAIRAWAFAHSLASRVMEQGRPACLSDINRRPDLIIPQPKGDRPLRSGLAAPLRVERQIVGTLEVYCHDPREWTQHDLSLIEWLAAQSSLVLESMQLQQELDLRRREAEDISMRKTRFLAAVSHDVRTPANAINLMAELISRAAGDASLQSQLPSLAADLQANARSLVALVSDVLDLARFDSGRMDLQEVEFALADVVDAEVRQLMPLAQAKGLALCADRPSQSLWLRTDRMKLARVIGNVLGNAIRFTDIGSVGVKCVQLPDGHVEIRISDTGVGISPEHLPHIFDEFFQLRNPERDRTKGTGLGLAICKRLLEAMGCDITVESTPGHGSTFTLIIPPALIVPPKTPTEPECDENAAQLDARSLAGLRILLVEDHHTTRRATAHLLAAEGATVIQAEGGRQAIHLLAHEYPQVLLLDLMLPDIDGSEVLRYLQCNRPSTMRCVLAVSGDATAARARQIEQLGADGLIAKPIDIQRLVKAIRAVLSGSVQTGALPRPCT